MRRREFIALLGGAAATWPVAARAQQRDRMRLIGALMGYAEKLRWGAADSDRIRTFAKELVELRPDAILGVTTPVISALARETPTIPIVFALMIDPIGNGFAASLAHPGGNITGFMALDPAMGGKWMELLKEIAPRTERVALLFNPATAPPIQPFMASIQTAASSFAVRADAAPVHAKDEIEGVVAEQAGTPAGGLNSTGRIAT